MPGPESPVEWDPRQRRSEESRAVSSPSIWREGRTKLCVRRCGLSGREEEGRPATSSFSHASASGLVCDTFDQIACHILTEKGCGVFFRVSGRISLFFHKC